MELCFRFSILEFCFFGIYLYFLFFRLYDAQMMDTHCVNKTSVIVLLQPMDCQRAVFVLSGTKTVLKEAGRIKSDDLSCYLFMTFNPACWEKGHSKHGGRKND